VQPSNVQAFKPLTAPKATTHPLALAYLANRMALRSHEEVQVWVDLWGIGFDAATGLLELPIRNFKGDLIGTKLDRRVFDPNADPKYTSLTGSKIGTAVFSRHPEDLTKMLIVEGEYDAMTAVLLGFNGIVVATQTNRLPANAQAELLAKAESCKQVYVCHDNDNPGHILVESVKEFIKNAKSVKLPDSYHDLNELLQKEGTEKARKIFEDCLLAAKSDLEKITFSSFDRLAETMEYLDNKLNTKGWSTGFNLLDYRLGGGLMPYTLTAISAPGKTGKTTFLIQLIYNLLSQGIKVGFISLEMSPVTHILPSLLSIASKKNLRKLEPGQRTPIIEGLKKDLPFLNNLSFMDRYGVTPSELIEAWISDQHLQHGVSVFFLDHVGYSLKDIKDINEHSLLSKRLRSLTRSYPIHIGAIVQPKGLSFGQQRVTKHDLYGSVTWSQDINALITLERSKEGQLHVRLTDSHNPLARPSDEESVVLFYDYESCSLNE
jgi:5S rRNA maturation endonuclease (ribonuclease M5)